MKRLLAILQRVFLGKRSGQPSSNPVAEAVLRVVLPYVLFAGLWILLSDRLLAQVIYDPAIRLQWSIYKGWAFVFVTALLLASLLRYEFAAREQSQAALRESEEQARHIQNLLLAVTEGTSDAVYVKDKQGRYLLINSSGSKLLGKSRQEVLFKDDTVFFAAQEAAILMAGDQRVMESRSLQTYEEHVTLGGQAHTFLATKGPVVDSEGNVIGLFGIARDITERQRAHEALEQRVIKRTAELAVAKDRAEAADRLKSAFLANMSHELRTPLNSIIGFTGIILQGLAGPLTEEQSKQLEMVRGSARHLLALINDVLDISKIEAGQMEVRCEPVDLGKVIEKAVASVRPQAQHRGLTLRVQTLPEPPTVFGDAQRIEQVVLNLVNNAIKFTERGQVCVECRLEAATMRVRVVDTGIGIKHEDLDRLFKPFFQLDSGLARRHEGTGLGLAICRRLIELMGGEICAESVINKGSVFSFTLPITPPLKT